MLRGAIIPTSPDVSSFVFTNMSFSEDENDPYSRWQGIRISQLGLCISLFLTFSVGTLGFSVNLLIQPRYCITGCAKIIFLLSIILGLLSLFMGSAAFLTRLADFRSTAAVARHRSDDSMRAEIERWRIDYKRFGRWTWRLFKCQVGTFGLQVLGLVVSLGVTYWSRLT
jgi:hypothetical protein